VEEFVERGNSEAELQAAPLKTEAPPSCDGFLLAYSLVLGRAVREWFRHLVAVFECCPKALREALVTSFDATRLSKYRS
jgi:hypothetical protein